MKTKLITRLTLVLFMTLFSFGSLFVMGQVMRYQDLQYQTCEGCDNTMESGSMTVPPNGFNYTNLVNFSENPLHLTSDFGPRIVTGSRYHIGVDISPQHENHDNGDAIFPIETGEIKILHVKQGYKYIAISGTHHYAYGHIFFYGIPDATTGMRSGDFILKKCDDADDDSYAIIYCPDGETPIAFGTSNTATVTHPDLNNGEAIAVTNVITDIDIPIAPVGNSATSVGGVPTHIHLYSFENEPNEDDWRSSYPAGYDITKFRNAKNPLENLLYVEGDFNLTVENTNNLTLENSNTYYGGEVWSHVRVRAELVNWSDQTYTVVNDLESVELFHRNTLFGVEPSADNWGTSSSNYQLFKGPWAESKFIYGGKYAHDRYPSENFPQNNDLIEIADPGRIGIGDLNYTTTAINPYCYNNHPYDDFLFSDIKTRIHKDDNFGHSDCSYAKCNNEARLKDGNYELNIRATNIQDLWFKANENLPIIKIDNFKPFVQKVEIFKENASQAEYSRAWVWANDQYQIEPFPSGLNFDVNDDISVVVTTSESMEKVTLSLNGYYNELTQSENEEKTIWNFEVADEYVSDGDNQLIIDGKDLANNDVQNFTSYSAEVPVRTGPETWIPPASNEADNWHVFPAEQAQLVDFTAEQLASDLYTVQFTDQSAATPIRSWEWDFGSGETSSLQNPMHQFPGEDTYPVTLTIIVYGTPPYSCTHVVKVDDLGMPSPEFIYSIGNSNKKSEVTVDFLDQSVGMISSWEWIFDDGQGNIQTSNLQNPTGISFLENKDYDVSLTVYNAIGDATEEKEFYYDPAQTPYVTLWEYGSTYFNREFDITSWNLSEPFTFEIDYGDGIIETAYENENWWHLFDHQYANTGTYTVVASVTGTGMTGMDETAYAIKQVNIQSFDLDIELSYVVESLDPYYINPSAGHSPPYPYQPVTISAQVSGAGGNPYYTGNWLIRKVDDPDFYETFTISSETSIEDITQLFPETGIYLVTLNLWSGSAHGDKTITIDVNNADEYVDVDLSGLIEVSVGYEGEFHGTFTTVGSQDLPDQYWWPTSFRWTLLKDDQVLDTHEDDFVYPSHYQTYSRSIGGFDNEGTYILRLETWNDQHNYALNQLLDIKYDNALPYYDYTELEITVSENLAFLQVISPELSHFYLDASEHLISIEITNTGNAPLYWQVEEGPDGADVEWFELLLSSEGYLEHDQHHTIMIQVDENEFYGMRFSGISISAFYDGYNGNEPVPCTFNYIFINQGGQMGPLFQSVEAGEYAVDNMKFGDAVAIYENYAVVGAPGNGGDFRGSAFVLSNGQGGIWTITAKLINTFTEPGFGLFGRSVDCHGRYIIVGAHRGMAIYKRPQNGWNGVINPISEYTFMEDSFGSSVAIWGDYAAVGAPKDDIIYTDAGMAQIFFKDEVGADEWGLVKQLNGIEQDDYFGTHVDIYNDIVAIGAPQNDYNSGYINIYNRNHQTSNDWGVEEQFTLENGSNVYMAQLGKVFDLEYNRISFSHYDVNHANYFHTNIYSDDNYIRNSSGTWSWDFGEINLSSNGCGSGCVGNLLTSISIPPNFHIHDGYPSFDGNSGSVFQYGAKGMNEWGNGNPEVPPEWYPSSPGDLFGKSLDASLTHTIIGAPGKNSNQGAILLDKGMHYWSWCETEYDLAFVNFEKLPGSYDDVVGRNIKLGGQSYPAIIKDGANITYEGVEIVLKDGFMAENGSEFTARSTDCNFQNEDGISDQSEKIASIDLMPLFRNMIRRMPEYPWHIFGACVNIDEIIILNENNEIVLQCEDPNFSKIDLNFINIEFEVLKTIFVMGDKKYILKLDGLEILLGQFINSGNKMMPSIQNNNQIKTL